MVVIVCVLGLTCMVVIVCCKPEYGTPVWVNILKFMVNFKILVLLNANM